MWDHAEAVMSRVLDEIRARHGNVVTTSLSPGEGAFYGPKFEYVLRDAIGRDWQCGTTQVDFNLPERFGAFYIAANSEKTTPVMVHRAICGSMERFIGILLEHHAGHLPLWLAPVQIVVCTITSDADEFALQFAARAKKRGLRVETDLRNEKINYKVREHSLAKVPVLLAVGRKEATENTVSMRRLGSSAQTSMGATRRSKRWPPRRSRRICAISRRPWFSLAGGMRRRAINPGSGRGAHVPDGGAGRCDAPGEAPAGASAALPFRPQTIHHATGLEERRWNLTAMRRDCGMRSASGSGGGRSLSAGFRLAQRFSTGCARAPAPRARKRDARRAIAEPAPSSSSRNRAGRLTYDAVNACILLLGQLDGAELITIEDLADGDALHPLQQAMVDWHGSQCGYCTPGIVMSLFAAYHSGSPSTRASLCDQLAGNLCRCTGYRPIIEAALATCDGAPDDRFAATAESRAEALARLGDDADLFVGDEASFFAAPASLEGLAALYGRFPDATLVAGATDVGLWVTKLLRDLKRVIWLGRVKGLDDIGETADGALSLGAGVTLADSAPLFGAIHADLGELMRRFGSTQVRVSGTVGGNIANGSPIGDLAPALIALGGRVVLRKGSVTRALPLEDFFVGYGKQDRAPGEFVLAVEAPRLAESQRFRAFKVSKRFDEDISAVMLAVRVEVDAAASSGRESPTAAWRRRRSERRMRRGCWSAPVSTIPRPGARRSPRSSPISRR